MPNFKCNSPLCSEFNKVVLVTQVKLVQGKSLSILCEACNADMVLDSNEIGEISVGFNKFKSLSDQDKKDIIKKRADDHYKNFEQKLAAQKKHDIIKDMKENFEAKVPKKYRSKIL